MNTATEAATTYRPCIGCDLRPVKGRTYCSTCRERIRRGLPTDLEAYPTPADLERLRLVERLQGRATGDFNRPPRAPLASRLRPSHRRGRR